MMLRDVMQYWFRVLYRGLEAFNKRSGLFSLGLWAFGGTFRLFGKGVKSFGGKFRGKCLHHSVSCRHD